MAEWLPGIYPPRCPVTTDSSAPYIPPSALGLLIDSATWLADSNVNAEGQRMGLGKVEVFNLNMAQGEVTEVERHFLFVGTTANVDIQGQLISVNAQSDISEAIGDDNLGQQVAAAQANAGQNWSAAVYGYAAGGDWTQAVDSANQTQSFEAVVLCDITTDSADFDAMQTKALALQSQLGRFCFVMAALPGIDATPETGQSWADYEAAMVALVNGVAANLVLPVPQLNGNNLGVLAGRLCNRVVTIADSPMRVATGPVLSLGEMPTDMDGKPLGLATLGTLAGARLSVPQWYPDYQGVYWGDGAMLEVTGGDYQVIEYVRAVHKASRRARFKAIARIADRILNSTPASIEMNKGYFMRDLRAMSKSVSINGIQFPGEVTPPKEGDIAIEWMSKTKVVIYMVVRPYNCPKEITVNIMLDLSNNAEG